MRKLKKLKVRKKNVVKRREDIGYRDGGEGCCKWIEDNCYVPVYPEGQDVAEWVRVGELSKDISAETGKSYYSMWEEQKKILYEALEMKNGRFRYRLIVLCWMRGEGKSILACLVQLWKFFNFPRQQIMLGANSKDQVKFVHYDIMRDIIQNSPNLLATIGKQNIQEKEIRFKDSTGVVRSIVRSISSFSGIVSNITGYTFSEIFDMKNPKFFVQLDGSIRNMPNAFGVIDSTVSAETHLLYNLYKGFINKKTSTVYFSYRYSKLGIPDDFWNPNMTKAQLDDYREKFPFGEFERYFQNLWSAGAISVFTKEMVEEMSYIGIGENKLDHSLMKQLLTKRSKLQMKLEGEVERKFVESSMQTMAEIDSISNMLNPVESIYSLKNKFGSVQCASIEELGKLTELFDTDWAILAGADLGDPLAVKGQARTIFTIIAKGLPGSRSAPNRAQQETNPKYLYMLLYVSNIPKHDVVGLKQEIEFCYDEYNGVDSLCIERSGAWDLSEWGKERDIAVEITYPSYGNQKEAFNELYSAISKGRFKAPPTATPGSKSEDVLVEEATIFMHDPIKKVFGSPKKLEKGGIQDDSMYSCAWCLYGGRLLGTDDFRPRTGKTDFGFFIPNNNLLTRY